MSKSDERHAANLERRAESRRRKEARDRKRGDRDRKLKAAADAYLMVVRKIWAEWRAA